MTYEVPWVLLLPGVDTVVVVVTVMDADFVLLIVRLLVESVGVDIEIKL
jgi:hypothetical protein